MTSQHDNKRHRLSSQRGRLPSCFYRHCCLHRSRTRSTHANAVQSPSSTITTEPSFPETEASRTPTTDSNQPSSYLAIPRRDEKKSKSSNYNNHNGTTAQPKGPPYNTTHQVESYVPQRRTGVLESAFPGILGYEEGDDEAKKSTENRKETTEKPPKNRHSLPSPPNTRKIVPVADDELR